MLCKPNVFSATITIPPSVQNETSLVKPPISNARMYRRVGDCLGSILQAEVLHGSDPLFTCAKHNKSELTRICKEFQDQFGKYARSLWPFDEAPQDGETALNWWRNILIVTKAKILPVSVVLRVS